MSVARRWREAGLDRMRTSPKTCSVYAHSSLIGTAAAEVRLLIVYMFGDECTTHWGQPVLG